MAVIPSKNNPHHRAGRASEPDRLTKHGRDARATGSAGLRAHKSVDSQQRKRIKRTEELITHSLNLLNRQFFKESFFFFKALELAFREKGSYL